MDDLKIRIPIFADLKTIKSETKKYIDKLQSTPIQLRIETATGIASQEMSRTAKAYEKVWEKAFFNQRQMAIKNAKEIQNAYNKQLFDNFNKSLGIGIIDPQKITSSNSALMQYYKSLDNISKVSIAKTSEAINHTFNNFKSVDTNKITSSNSALVQLFENSGKATTNFSSMEKQLLNLNPEIKNLGTASDKSAQSLTGIIGKFSQWYLIAGLVTTAIGTLKGSVTTIYNIDTAITNLRKVSEELGNTVGVKEFTKDMNDLAIAVGHSTESAIESVADFKRLGYTLEEAQVLAKQALIYSNISDQNIGDATKSIISTLKGFSLGVEDVNHVMDAYNEVGNNFAITSAGIGQALQRSSSALYEAGNSLEESIGLIVAGNASIQEVTRVGNGLKTVSMRIRGIADESGEAYPQLDKLINKLTGVDIMEDENTFKSTYDIMVEISKVWKDITDKDRASLLEAMFGKHQGAVGASILNNMSDGIKAMETAMNSFGSSTREQDEYMKSLMASVNTFRETLKKIWIENLDSGNIQAVIQGGTDFLNLIHRITSGLGGLNTILVALIPLIGNKLLSSLISVKMVQGALTIQTFALTTAMNSLKVSMLTLLTNPVTWFMVALTAIPVGLMAWANHQEKLRIEIENASNAQASFNKSLDEFNRTSNPEKIHDLANSFEHLGNAINYQESVKRIAQLRDEISMLQYSMDDGLLSTLPDKQAELSRLEKIVGDYENSAIQMGLAQEKAKRARLSSGKSGASGDPYVRPEGTPSSSSTSLSSILSQELYYQNKILEAENQSKNILNDQYDLRYRNLGLEEQAQREMLSYLESQRSVAKSKGLEAELNEKILKTQGDIASIEKDRKELAQSLAKLVVEQEKKVAQNSLDNAEREYETYKQVHEQRIKNLEEEIDALEEKADLENEAIERQRKQQEIQKAEERLQNTLNERNTRLFVNGQWTWVADPREVAKNTEDVQNLKEDYADWERKNSIAHQKKMLQDQIDYEKKSIEQKQNWFNSLKTQFDEQWKNLDQLADNYLALFGDNLDSAVNALLNKMGILNGQLKGMKPTPQTPAGGGSSGGGSSGGLYTGGATDYDYYYDAGQQAKGSGDMIGGVTKDYYVSNPSIFTPEEKAFFDSAFGFASGGETSRTGLHLLHGSDTKPERVLSPEQTESFNKLVDFLPSIANFFKVPSFNFSGLRVAGAGGETFNIYGGLNITANNPDQMFGLLKQRARTK